MERDVNTAKNMTVEERVRELAFELARPEAEDKEALRAELADLRATAIIARELSSTDADERLQAAELLRAVPGPDGVEPLIAALGDPVAKVRETCASALSQYGDERAVEPLIEALMRDSDPDVRAAAAQTLGRLGGDAARDALEQAYDTEQDDFTRLLIGDSLAFVV